MQLDGIRVLDLTQLLPGPYGTQLLADMGAEVVKIEPPDDGDYARLMAEQPGWPGHLFEAVNNGKKSVTLDLQADSGKEAFYDLVASADVVIEQFRPGVVERLGIDYDTLVEHNAEIVYCSLSGYGQEGPYKERVGHDINYVGFAGMIDFTRSSPDEPPSVPGYPVADMSGGLFAAMSVVSALLARELGNAGGNYIDLSMTDTVLSYAQVEAVMATEGLDPRPGETTQTGMYPCYDIYETADGRYITLAAAEPKFWRSFCEAIDRPDLIEHHMSQDEEIRERVREELVDVFSEHTWNEWEEQLGDADDMMFGLVKTPAEALEDPQIRERGLLRETTDGHTRLGYPAKAERGLDTGETSLPDLGEHTETVLQDSGFDFDRIEELRNDDVI